MQDAADHPPVVYPFFATHVRWQIGLDLPPLLIAQPKQVAPHLVDSRINELPENQQPIQPTTLLLSFDPNQINIEPRAVNRNSNTRMYAHLSAVFHESLLSLGYRCVSADVLPMDGSTS